MRLPVDAFVPGHNDGRAIFGIAVRERGSVFGNPVDCAARLLIEERRPTIGMALESVGNGVHLRGADVGDKSRFEVIAPVPRIGVIPGPLQRHVVHRPDRVCDGLAELGNGRQHLVGRSMVARPDGMDDDCARLTAWR